MEEKQRRRQDSVSTEGANCATNRSWCAFQILPPTSKQSSVSSTKTTPAAGFEPASP